ncbi:MAG: conjugal transfer protein TraX [Clostridia bacterium]|nr:conjugal transfer protein TraX [Clostridia bacterium]
MEKRNGLSRNTLKYIAVAAMLIDHIAATFVTDFFLYQIMRMIGRLTAPIMCYFLAEGYMYTSSKKKYGIRLFTFALISQVPYALLHHNTLLVLDFSMIMTLFLSFMILYSIEHIEKEWKMIVSVAFLGFLCIFCDWSIFAPFMVFIFYIFHDRPEVWKKLYIIMSLSLVLSDVIYMVENHLIWYTEICQTGMFLFLIAISMYNGKPGKKNMFSKYFFYVFYPLHLMILYLIKVYMH